jgi:hypothetical protein
MSETDSPVKATPAEDGKEAGDDAGYDWDNWHGDGSMQELNSIHAQHVTAVTSQATSAAWHADIAAKQAASLAQWVNYLWGQVAGLQAKVKELEDWKRKALDDMAKLRSEHKAIRHKVMPDAEPVDESVPPVPKAKSLPNMDASADGGTTVERKPMKAVTVAMSPPPGLEVSLDESPLEGVNVERTSIDGHAAEKAEWRIGHLSAKLKNCMGRALVSSPFSAWGMDDLRLMVFPDGKDVAKGPRNKKQKDLYAKKVTEGPLDACLRLKVPDCPAPHVLEYYLKIGNVRKGPFKHNFEESPVNGSSDFGIDWLSQMETDQSLVIAVEILKMADP